MLSVLKAERATVFSGWARLSSKAVFEASVDKKGVEVPLTSPEAGVSLTVELNEVMEISEFAPARSNRCCMSFLAQCLSESRQT